MYISQLSKYLRSLLIFGLAGLAAAGCGSLPDAGRAVVTGGLAPMPLGYLEYCRRSPESCERPPADLDRMRLTEASWALLEAVNAEINTQIVPAEDAALYGVEEFWTLPDLAGDCEDYVLAKRQALIAKGWPATALRIAVVDSPRTGRHAVLLAVTDRGDFVLDNTREAVLRLDEADYAWLSVQDPAEPLTWRRVASQTSHVPEARLALAQTPRRPLPGRGAGESVLPTAGDGSVMLGRTVAAGATD